jgi:hypothetical protein
VDFSNSTPVGLLDLEGKRPSEGRGPDNDRTVLEGESCREKVGR